MERVFCEIPQRRRVRVDPLRHTPECTLSKSESAYIRTDAARDAPLSAIWRSCIAPPAWRDPQREWVEQSLESSNRERERARDEFRKRESRASSLRKTIHRPKERLRKRDLERETRIGGLTLENSPWRVWRAARAAAVAASAESRARLRRRVYRLARLVCNDDVSRIVSGPTDTGHRSSVFRNAFQESSQVSLSRHFRLKPLVSKQTKKTGTDSEKTLSREEQEVRARARALRHLRPNTTGTRFAFRSSGTTGRFKSIQLGLWRVRTDEA